MTQDYQKAIIISKKKLKPKENKVCLIQPLASVNFISDKLASQFSKGPYAFN